VLLLLLLLVDVSVDVTSIDFSPFTEPVFLVRLLFVSLNCRWFVFDRYKILVFNAA